MHGENHPPSESLRQTSKCSDLLRCVPVFQNENEPGGGGRTDAWWHGYRRAEGESQRLEAW